MLTFAFLSRFLIALFLLATHAAAFTSSTRPAFTTNLSIISSKPLFVASGKDAGGPGPAVLDRPATIEKTNVNLEGKNAQQSERPKLPGWEVRLWNDPYNKREFVARCLAEVCGKSDTESFQIMMQAHKNGMGVIGRYDFEIAELYYSSLNEFGLLVDMVPVEDE
jgi:ATP-dependent Clp protease adapter protein ClpS